jgi:hypothetical protein
LALFQAMFFELNLALLVTYKVIKFTTQNRFEIFCCYTKNKMTIILLKLNPKIRVYVCYEIIFFVQICPGATRPLADQPQQEPLVQVQRHHRRRVRDDRREDDERVLRRIIQGTIRLFLNQFQQNNYNVA